MTKCKYFDCGFCYAPDDVSTSAQPSGACAAPKNCLYLKSQMNEPVRYETPMTEIEELKSQIQVLQSKLSFLEELERTKSPVEEAYKKVYGFYPKGRGNGVWTIGDEDTWSAFQKGYEAATQDYKVGEYQEPKENEWKSVALRFGEKLVSISPCGYYEYTPEGWYEWVVNTYEKLADDWLSLLKKEKIKKEKVEKSKINDLAEKLLPDDHPYKIADEHGETNPYKQGLNSVEDEKKMEELGFVKNSDGSWTAQPLGETVQEQVKKLQEKNWYVDAKTLLKSNWEPKPQSEEEVAEGLRSAMRKAKEDGVFDEPKESWMDEMVAELKGQTLYDVCMNWWGNVFTSNEEWDAENAIKHLVDLIETFLPKEQIANSQNTYVELSVEGFNDAIKQIKSRLR